MVESLSKGNKTHRPNLIILSDNDTPLTVDEGQQSSVDEELIWSKKVHFEFLVLLTC